MGDFALIICYKETEKLDKIGFIRFLKYKLRLVIENIKKQNAERWFERVEFTEHTSIYLINLPFHIDELKQFTKKRIEKIQGKILKVCRAKGIKNCILPAVLTGLFENRDFFITSCGGQMLFKSILIDIINKVYSEKSVSISELDVAVIAGENELELLYMINMLSGIVKYLTVVTGNKEAIESEINNILEETGLAMGITSDVKNTLRNSQLVICLRKINIKSDEYSKMRKTIINYSGDSIEGFKGDLVINGITVGLPQQLLGKIKKEVYSFFSNAEIAEIFICKNGVDLVGQNRGQYNNNNIMSYIYFEFGKGGYKITGFF